MSQQPGFFARMSAGLSSFFFSLMPAFLSPATRAGKADLERAYKAGQLGGAYQLWSGSNSSAEAEVRKGRARTTARVRDLDQNNPFVAGMADKRSVRILGDEIGITPQIMVGEKLNGPLNKLLERRFYRWAEAAFLDGSSLTEGLTIGSNHDLFDGEYLVKRVITTQGGNSFRLQGFECDHLDTSKGIQGITYDASGQVPVTYHIRTIHPSDPDMSSSAVVDVPASDIFHYRSIRRFSQRRGISPLAPAVMRLYGIDDLEDAELQACRSAASIGVIMKTPLAGSLPDGHYVGPDGSEATVTPIKDGNNKNRRYMEAGAYLELGEGEEAKVFESNRPNSNFDPFIRNRKRDTTGTAGLSYEEATGDYSQVNFSSARMAQNIAWALTKRQQAKQKRLLNWIYRQWLSIEVFVVGVPGISRPAFQADPIPYQETTWQLAGNQGIDPLKEAETLAQEIALGVQSRTNYCAERGRDRLEITKQLTSEKADLVDAGLYQEDPVVPKVVSESEVIQSNQGGAPDAQGQAN